jgi:NIMA (never in mitosis gene a)-related kinase
MLEKDPKRRPTIHQILRHPLVKNRIPGLLNSDDFREEFSHTVLHGRDVFQEKKEENQKKIVDEKALKNDFKPTNGVAEE